MAGKDSDDAKRRKPTRPAAKKPAPAKPPTAPATPPSKAASAKGKAKKPAPKESKPAKPRRAKSEEDALAEAEAAAAAEVDSELEAAPPRPAAKTPARKGAAPTPPPPPVAEPEEDEDEDEEDDDEDDGGESATDVGEEFDAAGAAVNGEVERPAATGEAAKPRPKKVVPIPQMPARRADGTITIAYSPDADDAFMFYALENGKVDTEGRKYDSVRKDIETLNSEAKKGTYDVTALSFGAYPFVFDRYALLSCGASFGDQHGPILVARSPVRPDEVDGLQVAVPGTHTTASLAVRLWLHPSRIRLFAIPFDKIALAVRAGKIRSGLLIHEGQLTWKEQGLVRVVDLGQWWGEKTEGLPLPLGATGIRRDIPEAERQKIALDIKRSIAYGLGHREEALEYAMKFARGLDKARVDKYVQMYVNELTLDFGERGKQAAQYFLDEAHRHGFIPSKVDIETA